MVKHGEMWCLDVFDKFVVSGQSVSLGEAVTRRYRPVNTNDELPQRIVLGLFASDSDHQEVEQKHFFSQTINVCTLRKKTDLFSCVFSPL